MIFLSFWKKSLMLTKSAFIWLVKNDIVKYYYNTITTAFYFKLLFIYSYSKLNFQQLLVLCHMILQKCVAQETFIIINVDNNF